MDISSILRALSPEAQVFLFAFLLTSATGVILILLVVALFPGAARNISQVLSNIDHLLRGKNSLGIGHLNDFEQTISSSKENLLTDNGKQKAN
jgi:hypothetical protein